MFSNNGDKFLLVEGICLDETLLTDESLLTNTLLNLPPVIDMRPIREPIVSKAKNNPGLEGYVPIDESNITISTYTNNPRLVACIHSCKDFDSERVIDYLKKQYPCLGIKIFSCYESEFRET